MLGEDLDAASAGFRVGYEDTSHFSREYKRLFGKPPTRDDCGRRRDQFLRNGWPSSAEGTGTKRGADYYRGAGGA